jgi:hypothetical protein
VEISESINIIKSLADTSRLLIVQSLEQPQCVEELAQRCNLAPSTISFHLGKLEKAGLVKKKKEQYYAVYSLNDAIFNKSLRDLTSFSNPEKYLQEERLERYRTKVLKAFMKNGKVVRIPAQYKKRLIILEEILKRFKPSTQYKESDVNETIKEVCDDYVTIRRAFIDENLMTRSGDMYRIAQPNQAAQSLSTVPSKGTTGNVHMKMLKEIKREYKDRKKPAGVFQVKNMANGKILLGSSLNLEGPLNSHKFMLTTGKHRNEALQKDWDTFGVSNFVFEILEVVKVKDDPGFNLSDELTLLEQIWLEKLQPFGERGYNTTSTIRQA